MDKHHFGSEKCHELLVAMLNQLGKPNFSHKAVSMIQRYNVDRKAIARSNLPRRIKLIALDMLQERYINLSVKNTTLGYYKKLESVIQNVIITGCREEKRRLKNKENENGNR